MTENRKDNPQRKLSKNLLVHALLDLMGEVPYNQINITDLSRKADLSRRTFYRHFATVDEVLDYVLVQISEQFSKYQTKQKPSDLKAVTYTFFSYWEKHKQFLQILKNNNLLYRLHDKFMIVPNDRKRIVTKSAETPLIEYAVCFTSGAIWDLLIQWLDNGATQTPSEMAEIVEKILSHLCSK